MQRKTKRIIAAVFLIGALAAGGAAFTAANTIPDSVAGYGTSNITGATAKTLSYTLNGDGTVITGATLLFQQDLTQNATDPTATPYTVKAGFNSNNLQACTIGSYSSSAPTGTTVTCGSDATGGTPYTQSTSGASTFNVSVTSGP